MKSQELIAKIVGILTGHEEGMRQSRIAQEADTHPENVARALARAHKHGVLLQEDDRGRISLPKWR